MIGPLGRLGAAASLGQHCPQMTQSRCTCLHSPENVVHELVAGVEDPHVMLDAVLGGELLQVVAGGEDGSGGAQHHAAGGVIRRGLSG